MYLFPKTTISKWPKIYDLPSQKYALLQFQKLEVLEEVYSLRFLEPLIPEFIFHEYLSLPVRTPSYPRAHCILACLSYGVITCSMTQLANKLTLQVLCQDINMYCFRVHSSTINCPYSSFPHFVLLPKKKRHSQEY